VSGAPDPDPSPPLVEGRSCGACGVCCLVLTVREPDLQKLPGHRCPHSREHDGCAVYATRPRICRGYYCGWRTMKWVRPTLRPDISHVLVNPVYGLPQPDMAPRDAVGFILLSPAALDAEGLAESVAAAVAADVPTFITTPGPPGFAGPEIQLNELLAMAVWTRDKAALLRALRRYHDECQSGPFVPSEIEGALQDLRDTARLAGQDLPPDGDRRGRCDLHPGVIPQEPAPAKS